MAEDNKYSVTITAKSGDRVLYRGTWPEQDYLEFVTAQAIIGKAFSEAGFARARLEKGHDVPAEVLAAFGLGEAPKGTIR